MVKIEITRNGTVIKSFTCPKTLQQSYFAEAHSMAGGMWNGVDEFKVLVSEA
jgi:hypothetical protein